MARIRVRRTVDGGRYHGVIDEAGREVLPCVYDALSPFGGGRALARRDGKLGVVDESGRVVRPCEVDLEWPLAARGQGFQEGVIFLSSGKGLFSMNPEGAVAELAEVAPVLDQRRGLALVGEDDAFGVVDAAGRELVPREYESLDVLAEGPRWVIAMRGGLYGLLDPEAGEVLPFEYEYLDDSSFGLERIAAAVYADAPDPSYGWVQADGCWAVEPAYEKAWGYVEGYALVRSGDDSYGLVDAAGELVVPQAYPSLGDVSEGLCGAQDHDGRRGYLSPDGAVAVPFEYEDSRAFSCGRGRVRREGKVGFVDPQGKVVVPLEYDLATDFRDGLALVGRGGAWGAIDPRGELVIPVAYEHLAWL
jgi:hypothetical protein